MNDAVVAMDIDRPKGDGFEFQVLSPSAEFPGTNGDGRLHLLGLTGIDGKDEVDVFIVNTKPSVDLSTGEVLDQTKVGTNSTIEHFTISTGPGTTEMQYIKTFAHPQIATPNNIALIDRNSFYFINDHGTSNAGGLAAHLSPFIRSGDVSYCHYPDPSTHTHPDCKKVAGSLQFPNGPVLGHDGLLYVPSAFAGGIHVYSINEHDHSLRKVDFIDIPYGMDNLSLDAEGAIFAPAFPKQGEMLAAFADPLGVRKSPVSAVFRVVKGKGGEGWEVKKVVEDKEGEKLPGATAVVHDAKTGRLFLAGIVSPFITVCEPK